MKLKEVQAMEQKVKTGNFESLARVTDDVETCRKHVVSIKDQLDLAEEIDTSTYDAADKAAIDKVVEKIEASHENAKEALTTLEAKHANITLDMVAEGADKEAKAKAYLEQNGVTNPTDVVVGKFVKAAAAKKKGNKIPVASKSIFKIEGVQNAFDSLS